MHARELPSGGAIRGGELVKVLLAQFHRLTMGKPKNMDELFSARHFDRDVIIQCVRWCLRRGSACSILSR
jgi:hypothetical protein